LGYFGESYAVENCRTCDNCTGRREAVEATVEARIILSAVARTGERFGAGHVVDIVCGADTEKIRRLGHDQLKTYGAGRDRPKKFWQRIIDGLIAQGALAPRQDGYPVLAITEPGRELVLGKRSFSLVRQLPAKSVPVEEPMTPAAAFYPELFENLRTRRTALARTEDVPPYVVFSDRTLREMAARLPTSPADLLKITGVGEAKLNRYGPAVLEVITAFRKGYPERIPLNKNDLPASGAEGLRTTAARSESATVEATWELVRQGLGLEETAARRKLTLLTIRSHVEALILAGKEVDLDRLVDPEKQAYLAGLLAGRPQARLREIMDASDGSATWDEIALVKAWLNRPGSPQP
jgi:hypothetical protein